MTRISRILGREIFLKAPKIRVIRVIRGDALSFLRRSRTVGLSLLAVAVLLAIYRGSESAGTLDSEPAPVVFVCRNGVAMSVWSALTFERLAAQRGLRVRAASRAAAATFTDVPFRMRLALALEGYRVGSYRPRVITAEDVDRARRVIVIDTELPASASTAGVPIEHWGGFPAMRDEYFASRAALRARVEELVERLASAALSPTGS
jgi:hypothetical protein